MGEVTALPQREAPPLASPVRVRVDRVEIKNRLRPVDPDWAAFIADDVAKNGLRVLPWARFLPGGRVVLVVGAHRMAAVRLLGWDEVDVHPFEGDADAARAWEIAENLVRRDLGVLDRAAFTAELYELERRRAGWEDGVSAHALAAGRRWAKDASDRMSKASELEAGVAAKVGLSERSIRRYLELFRGLNPQARALLADHPVRENAAQLRLLARQSDQLKIVKLLVAGEVKSVAEAVARFTPRAASDPADKRMSAFLGAYQRAGEAERRLMLAKLHSTFGAPRGMTFEIGERGRG